MPPAVVIRSLLVFDEKHPLHRSYRVAKRIAIAIVGGSIVIAGIVLAVAPVLPGWPAIFLGLGILSLEFAWARSWLKKIKAKAQSVAGVTPRATDTEPRP